MDRNDRSRSPKYAPSRRSGRGRKQRVVEIHPRQIAQPFCCLDVAQDLLRESAIRCDLRGERNAGEPIDACFVGTLRIDQEGRKLSAVFSDVFPVNKRLAMEAFAGRGLVERSDNGAITPERIAHMRERADARAVQRSRTGTLRQPPRG